MLLPCWKNKKLLNPEEIWRLKIASMVIGLGWNRRDRSKRRRDVCSVQGENRQASIPIVVFNYRRRRDDAGYGGGEHGGIFLSFYQTHHY